MIPDPGDWYIVDASKAADYESGLRLLVEHRLQQAALLTRSIKKTDDDCMALALRHDAESLKQEAQVVQQELTRLNQWRIMQRTHKAQKRNSQNTQPFDAVGEIDSLIVNQYLGSGKS